MSCSTPPQFEPNEGNVDSEKNASLALVSKLEREGWSASSTKKARKSEKDGGGGGGENAGTEGVLNVRKAVRYASKGRGATAMVPRGGKKARGGKGKR
jgi:regulator of ribosome biosynthesis